MLSEPSLSQRQSVVPLSKSFFTRLGPLTGLAFAALLAIFKAIEAGAPQPEASASTAKVVAYWTNHNGAQATVAILASFGALFLVWFAGVLRMELLKAEEGTLASISFAGAVIGAIGILAVTTLAYAAADTAGDVPSQVTQTLSVLQAETFLPIAAGFAIFGIATGLVVIRTAVLPVWLGWSSLIAGLLWLTPEQQVGLLFSVLFIVGASILLSLRSESGRTS